jgi:hypothetical protein
LADSSGIDWEQEVTAVLQEVSCHFGTKGNLLHLDVGEVEWAAAAQKKAHSKQSMQQQKQAMQQQQIKQTQPGDLLLTLKADLQLPAGLLKPAARHREAAAEQGDIQQHQVIRYGPSAQVQECSQQRLDAGSLHVSVEVLSAKPPQKELRSMPSSAWKACAAEQEAAAQSQLRRKLFATLAGLLKWQLLWQLRGEQRQLLEAGAFWPAASAAQRQ